jgi:serine/threonine-protein kinase
MPEVPVDPGSSDVAATCPVCRQIFSGNGRFCPFDGEKLEIHELQQSQRDGLLGQVIDDRYEVLAVIGEGGMGRVYRVRHLRLGRVFALKALRADLALDPVLKERFVREARAAAVVSHPNVVQINDFGTLPSGQSYFVMELLEGRTLTRVLREEGPLDPRRCAEFARQIAEALAAAHAKGVIHRDLKPDNVILQQLNGDHSTVKVLDFGLAKVAISSRLTRPGVAYGTPHYMSPEQAGGESFDHRVDVYALGIVMFEMVTGRVPFEDDTYMGVLSKHLYATPPKPHEYYAPAGELAGFEAVIAGCLAKNPADRWPSMIELARRLDSLANMQPGGSSRAVAESPTVDLPTIPIVHLRHWCTVGMGLVLLIGGGLCWSMVVRNSSSLRKSEGVSVPGSASDNSSDADARPPAPTVGLESARPIQPEATPSMSVPAMTAGPARSPNSAGRGLPPANPVRKESKVLVRKRKFLSVGSNDIADPWAK